MRLFDAQKTFVIVDTVHSITQTKNPHSSQTQPLPFPNPSIPLQTPPPCRNTLIRLHRPIIKPHVTSPLNRRPLRIKNLGLTRRRNCLMSINPLLQTSNALIKAFRRILILPRLRFPKAERRPQSGPILVLGRARQAVVIVVLEEVGAAEHGVDPVGVVGEGDDGGVAGVGAADCFCFVVDGNSTETPEAGGGDCEGEE